ncbi:MAG: ABC transporter permease subunit [Anaerolineae bacterium]|nr:ABC transporter permease subunit [Anaerolineae bacterium]MCB9131357.1 ABC transporter permease subunit [Anaerolineales bacterium]MCB0250578.1 ABC transporter permease subunit [Anaerolineae bacterium]MCB9141057.1 ABC transporter permease subunit [Anaerolineales bacterium]MCO5242476.1 ABC transporter permease subunit [Anaerolineae bacterium]
MAAATDTPSALDLAAARRERSPWGDAWNQLIKNRLAIASLVYIIVLTLMSIFANSVAPFKYDRTILSDTATCSYLPIPFICPGGTVAPSGTKYMFGADELGRDILSRTIYGGQVSLAVGLVGAFVSMVLGMVYGLIAGYGSQRLDNIMMRLVDFLYAMPILIFIILLQVFFKAKARQLGNVQNFEFPHWFVYGILAAALVCIIGGILAGKYYGLGVSAFLIGLGVFALILAGMLIALTLAIGGSPWASLIAIDNAMGGMFFLFIALGFLNWLGMARLTRGQVLSFKKKEFIEAAHMVGSSDTRIIFRHLLPNVLGPCIVAETLAIPGYIALEAFLSFIGLGINPPRPSWGNMISTGYPHLRSNAHILVLPAVALTLTILAFNFLGDGLRDAFDPRLRE